MTNNHDDSAENSHFSLDESNGLAEIQNSIKEIEKLKAGGLTSSNQTSEDDYVENQEEDSKDDEQELINNSDDEQEYESSEEENEDERESDEEELTSKKPPKKLDKIWKIKKGYYKEKAEKAAVLEENARLREMISQLETAGTYQYGKNIYTELERAKDQMQKAIDEGDQKAFGEAVVNLTNVQHKVNELEKLASQAPSPTPQIEQSYLSNDGYRNEIFDEAAQDFLSSHKELQQGSKFYNKALAESVVKYANKLDRQIQEAGREDIYYTEAVQDYFDLIEDHMSEYNSRIEKKQKNIESSNHVGGVRNSYSSSSPGKSATPIKVTLTPDEKRMCANSFGAITEKAWLKYKAEQQLKEGNLR